MHNFKLECMNNELVVIDINTGKPIGYLTYDRSFINATLELKATIMDRVPISAHEKKKQYEKDYYQPPQSDNPPKILTLHEPKTETSQSQTDSKKDSATEDVVTRISALSKLVSKVTAIQNVPKTDTEKAKPMLVSLSRRVSITSTPREDSSCPCCNGTGAFIRGRISRSCFRCGGKGYMDDTDYIRYDAYRTSRGYADKTTYRDHNNNYTIR